MSDPLREQYRTGANLSARISLHQRFRVSGPPFHDWLFDRVSIGEGTRVLELGCGTAVFWQEVSSRVPRTSRLLLTDFSEGMVRETSRVTRDISCRVDVAVADAGAIPVRNGSVDLVIAHHMLYHVPDLARTLEEIRRALVPEGVLSAATISEQHLHHLNELVAKCVPDLPSAHKAVGRFNVENGRELLAPWFRTVDMAVHEGELHVTEADAVIAYLRSTGTSRRLAETALERIEQDVREEIAARGAFVLSTKNAVFTCRN